MTLLIYTIEHTTECIELNNMITIISIIQQKVFVNFMSGESEYSSYCSHPDQRDTELKE